MKESNREALSEKIRNSPHQSKEETADIVFYDFTGRFIFEVYSPAGGSVKLINQKERIDLTNGE
jgi:hypothetical protein